MAVRILESPQRAWYAREQARYQRGDRRNPPEYKVVRRLGVPVLDGYARVDEALTYREAMAGGRIEERPLWHELVFTAGFRDVTAELDPESGPPAVPLPGPKPYRAQEVARQAEMQGIPRSQRRLHG